MNRSALFWFWQQPDATAPTPIPPPTPPTPGSYDLFWPGLGGDRLDGLTTTGSMFMAVLIEIGLAARSNGQVNFWDDNSGGPADQDAGTILDGSVTVALDAVDHLTRIGKFDDSNDRFILNGDATALGDVFRDPAQARASFVYDNADGDPVLMTLGDARSGGTNWVDWWRSTGNLTDEQWAAINGWAAGDEIIFAIHSGDASYTEPGAKMGIDWPGLTAPIDWPGIP